MGAWCRERWVPVAVAVAFVVVGFDYVIVWNGLPAGPFDVWLAPSDLWGTYLAAVSLAHGHFSTLYVAVPGAVLLLVPVAAVGHALGLEVGPEFSAFAAPTGWILVGPYVLGLTTIPLFAADRLCRRRGVGSARRLALALALAVVLANATVKWGHPEDAVALGLVLFAVDAGADGRWRAAGWLVGLAVVVQPFALLAVPALGAFALGRGTEGGEGRRRAWALLWRSVLPYAAALGPALLLDWSASSQWLLHQPNFPQENHPTPFTAWAHPIPHSLGGVSAGPGRLVALVVAVAVSAAVARFRPPAPWLTLWVVALSFAVWLAAETVLDSYYVVPSLAVGLVVAAARGPVRLMVAAAAAVVATWFSNVRWQGVWPWWLIVVALVTTVLVAAWPGRLAARAAAGDPPSPEAGPGAGMLSAGSAPVV